MSYRVVLLRWAKRDAQSIFDWIARRSSSGAITWSRALDKALMRLEQAPLGFGPADEAEEFHDVDLRQVLFKTPRGRVYRAVFVVTDREVRVLRIRAPGQQTLSESELQ